MNRLFRLLCVLPLALLLSPGVAAQELYEQPAKQVHWATAAFFGTGWYRVADNRSSYIFRIPPRQTLSQAGWDKQGERRLGWEILYPVALGLHKLDDLPDFIELDNYSTITFTPGIAVDVPINERWHLRPYLHLGVGYEASKDEWARIFYGGVNSRLRMSEDEDSAWSLLGALYFAGYKPSFKSRGRYGSIMFGAETHRRLDGFELFGESTWLNTHLTYDYFFDNINFNVSPTEQVSIRDTWELGVSLGYGGRKVKIGWFSFEQLGLSYKWSSNGKYKAISFNLRSPFTR